MNYKLETTILYYVINMEKEDKNFNRLILIGNGFDLLHGLRTRYSDFVKDYLASSVNNFFIKNRHSDNLLEITYQDSFRPLPTPSYGVDDIYSFFEELDTKYNGK